MRKFGIKKEKTRREEYVYVEGAERTVSKVEPLMRKGSMLVISCDAEV